MNTHGYTLWTYDVWGNAEDGYDVNDKWPYMRDLRVGYIPWTYNRRKPGQFTILAPTDQMILDALIECGYLKAGVTLDDIEIDGDGEDTYWLTESEDGRPLCELTKNG